MPKISHACVIALLSCAASTAVAASRPPWPSTLPVYDHIVIVVEENRDFEQILGASLTRRISGNWRQRAPYSSACLPRSTIAKATIPGCSQVAIRTSAFAIRCRAKPTTPTTRSRPATSASN